ncbi:ABCB26 [Symbiodinium sp. CCMP2592]|nr:ABCB26 [Symbiodinium sp. CCMP2592]
MAPAYVWPHHGSRYPDAGTVPTLPRPTSATPPGNCPASSAASGHRRCGARYQPRHRASLIKDAEARERFGVWALSLSLVVCVFSLGVCLFLLCSGPGKSEESLDFAGRPGFPPRRVGGTPVARFEPGESSSHTPLGNAGKRVRFAEEEPEVLSPSADRPRVPSSERKRVKAAPPPASEMRKRPGLVQVPHLQGPAGAKARWPAATVLQFGAIGQDDWGATALRYIKARLATSTQRLYASHWTWWALFCSRRGISPYRHVPCYNETEESLFLDFILHTSLNGLRSHGTIKMRLAAIRSEHLTVGLPNPLAQFPRIPLVLDGIKRKYPALERRHPVTPTMLLAAVKLLQHEKDGPVIVLALFLGFFFLLRASELIGDAWHGQTRGLRGCDVVLLRGGKPCPEKELHLADELRIFIQSSKTDIYNAGASRNHFATGQELCPVRAAVKVFQLYPQRYSGGTEQDEHLLRGEKGDLLTRQFLQLVLQQCAEHVGEAPALIKVGARAPSGLDTRMLNSSRGTEGGRRTPTNPTSGSRVNLREGHFVYLGYGRGAFRARLAGVPFKNLPPEARIDYLWLFLGVSGLVLTSLAEVASPPLVAAALFAAVEGSGRVQLAQRACAVAAAAVLGGVAEGLKNFAFNMLRSRLVSRLREDAFDALMGEELSFYDEVDAGELTSRLSSDCMSVYSYLSDVLSFFLRSGFVTAASLLALFRLDFAISSRLAVLLVLLWACSEWYGRVTRSTGRKTQDSLAELGRVANEALSLLRTVRALCAEALHCRLFRKRNVVIDETQRERGLALGLFSAAANGTPALLSALALFFGGHMVLAGQMTGEALATYLLYLDTAADGALELGIEWSSCNDALGSAERVVALLATSKSAAKTRRGRRLAGARGDLRFTNVCFAYPSRPQRQILTNLSLHCPAGKTTALVGFSGSGKSSLLGLLLRFYDLKAGSGSVAFDGVDVTDLDPAWLRNQLGVVGQQPKLFRASIKENIAWGLPGASDAMVRQAAETARAAAFIESLPQGYDTICADDRLLSGGQRQRIAIARALIRDPAVLLLDEPTSALDAASSAEVSRALEQAQWSESRGVHRTVIIVAHDLRLSMVQRADKIVVMDTGQIIEEGQHEELLKLGGGYTRPVSPGTCHYVRLRFLAAFSRLRNGLVQSRSDSWMRTPARPTVNCVEGGFPDFLWRNPGALSLVAWGPVHGDSGADGANSASGGSIHGSVRSQTGEPAPEPPAAAHANVAEGGRRLYRAARGGNASSSGRPAKRKCPAVELHAQAASGHLPHPRKHHERGCWERDNPEMLVRMPT